MSRALMDYLSMGGYGFFVWGSFGVAALVLLIEALAVKARHRRAVVDARMTEEESMTLSPATEAAR